MNSVNRRFDKLLFMINWLKIDSKLTKYMLLTFMHHLLSKES